jgi:hypothetical protein
MFKNKRYVDIILCYLILSGLAAHICMPLLLSEQSAFLSTLIGGMTGLFGSIVSSFFHILLKFLTMLFETIDKIIGLDSKSAVGGLIIGCFVTEGVRFLFNRKTKKEI